MSVSVRNGIITVVIVAALVVLAMPFVARQKEEARREATVHILATLAMAKTAYAVENEVRDGATVTVEQMIAPRPAREERRSSVTLPRLTEKPVFPYTSEEGQLILGPIGEMPVFKLKSGETIVPRIERPASPIPE